MLVLNFLSNLQEDRFVSVGLIFMLIALYGARQLYKRHPSLGEKFGWLKSKMQWLYRLLLAYWIDIVTYPCGMLLENIQLPGGIKLQTTFIIGVWYFVWRLLKDKIHMKISDSAFSQKGDFDALGYGLAIIYGIIVALSLFIG